MKIGYVRDSGFDSIAAEVQRSRLTAAGCERFFEDSSATQGSELIKLLSEVKRNDVLFVTSLVQIGRPIKMVLEMVGELAQQGVELRSLEEQLKLSTTESGPVLKVFNDLLKMNLALINERTKRSLSIAKVTGRTGGRPTAKLDDQLKEIELLLAKAVPVREIANSIGTSHTTLYRFIKTNPILKKYAR